jgi:hypothetical protein
MSVAVLAVRFFCHRNPRPTVDARAPTVGPQATGRGP